MNNLNESSKPFYKKWWGIALVILFLPFTLSYLVIKNKNLKLPIKAVLLLAIWGLFLSVSLLDESKKQYAVSRVEPTQVVNQPEITSAMESPTIIKEKSPEETLEEIASKYTTEPPIILNEDEGYVVIITGELRELAPLLKGKEVSRNFIFEVYGSGLPIKQAAIAFHTKDQKKYRSSLSYDIAQKLPTDIWSKSEIEYGYSQFHNFLQANTTGTSLDADKAVTYVETNIE